MAGGWVRDKLLGKDAHDVDISVEGCTGQRFAEILTQYMQDNNLETHSVGVIQANPEKSKSLETATTKVLGEPIDFVGLRKETYTEDSRVPKIEEATIEEDCFRRDFRCNALYYNLNQ